jgi:SAM-dependent methyltransferase
MPEFSLPRSDDPFDFRRQAGTYGIFRRDYSPGLYEALSAHAGSAAGRRAIDLGCGTGFVTASLTQRDWRVVGIDFSAPMLAEAQRGGHRLVRARAEALPVRSGSAALLTCGTAFHWFSPVAALAEIRRVLAPRGWAALFWRYPRPEARTVALVGAALRTVNPAMPADAQQYLVHSPAPFAGSGWEALPLIRLTTVLRWTAETFVGYAATVEWYRRLAGEHHAAFLTALRASLAAEFPGGFEEPNEEYLFLARRSR